MGQARQYDLSQITEIRLDTAENDSSSTDCMLEEGGHRQRRYMDVEQKL